MRNKRIINKPQSTPEFKVGDLVICRVWIRTPRMEQVRVSDHIKEIVGVILSVEKRRLGSHIYRVATSQGIIRRTKLKLI